MTEKELKALNKAELLEIIIKQSEKIRSQQTEIKSLKAELSKKELTLEDAGNIAEAALKVNKVFETAQKAADQYLASIKYLRGLAIKDAAESFRDVEGTQIYMNLSEPKEDD